MEALPLLLLSDCLRPVPLICSVTSVMSVCTLFVPGLKICFSYYQIFLVAEGDHNSLILYIVYVECLRFSEV